MDDTQGLARVAVVLDFVVLVSDRYAGRDAVIGQGQDVVAALRLAGAELHVRPVGLVDVRAGDALAGGRVLVLETEHDLGLVDAVERTAHDDLGTGSGDDRLIPGDDPHPQDALGLVADLDPRVVVDRFGDERLELCFVQVCHRE